MLSAKLRSVGSRFCNSAGANTAGTPQVLLWARAVEEKSRGPRMLSCCSISRNGSVDAYLPFL